MQRYGGLHILSFPSLPPTPPFAVHYGVAIFFPWPVAKLLTDAVLQCMISLIGAQYLLLSFSASCSEPEIHFLCCSQGCNEGEKKLTLVLS